MRLVAHDLGPEKGEYWDSPNSTMLHLYGYVKAAVTGESPKTERPRSPHGSRAGVKPPARAAPSRRGRTSAGAEVDRLAEDREEGGRPRRPLRSVLADWGLRGPAA
jgi:hypothetical protein